MRSGLTLLGRRLAEGALAVALAGAVAATVAAHGDLANGGGPVAAAGLAQPTAGPTDGAGLAIGPVDAAGDPARAYEPVQLAATVSNPGSTPAIRVEVVFAGHIAGSSPGPLASAIVDIGPRASALAVADWSPTGPGTWLVAAAAADLGATGPSSAIVVEGTDTDGDALDVAQNLSTGVVGSIVALLAIGALLVGRSGQTLFRP